MALPFPDDRFDAAVMALVIFFVPEPAKGVAEMARVVRPGGTVAAYAWDLPGGGFPLEPVFSELRALGQKIWARRGLRPPPCRLCANYGPARGCKRSRRARSRCSGRSPTSTSSGSVSAATGSIKPMLAALSAGDLEKVKSRVRDKLAADAAGRITYGAFANAVKGRVPN